jgi:hypothetical protein
MPWKPNLPLVSFVARLAVLFVFAMMLASTAGKREDVPNNGYALRQVRN